MGKEEECLNSADLSEISEEDYCLPSWDKTVCWPLTPINQSATLPCPPIFPQIDPSKTFTRLCESDGSWEDGLHYQQCFKSFDERSFTQNATEEQLRFYNSVINGAKMMELVGLFLSWTGLMVALLIFYCFRNLRCHRTKIHQHLFIAFIFRLTIEIILGVDRFNSKIAATQGYERDNSIQNVAPLCKTFEVLREYTRICTFAWMFIEGIYLNTLLSSAVFGTPKFVLFYIIGWAIPVSFVVAWAIVMDLTSSKLSGCWHGHVDSIWYWVFIEIPRNLMLVANVLFLFNIIRVLVTKLRESNTSDTKQVRKALKAAIVLLPLLGIANLVWLIPRPKPGDDRAFILIYHYLFLFLDAYQGFFVAVLYCFVNAEVRATLRRKWSAWRNSRSPHHHRGHSIVTTATDIRMSLFDNGHVPAET